MAVNGIAVLDTVGAAGRFARANTRHAIGPLTLAAVAATASLVGNYTGIAWLGLATFFQLIGSFMAMGALLRRAFAGSLRDRPEDQAGPAGFQWTAHEWRLLGAEAILWALFLALIFAAVFVLAIVLVATGAATAASVKPNMTPEEFAQMLGPQGMLGLSIMSVVFAALLVWIAVRLTLFAPATIYTRSVALFSSWTLTKGRFWGVFLVLLLVSLPSVVMSIVTYGVQQALGHPVGMSVALDTPVALGISAATALVSCFIQLPLTIGAYAQLYKKLAGASVEVF